MSEPKVFVCPACGMYLGTGDDAVGKNCRIHGLRGVPSQYFTPPEMRMQLLREAQQRSQLMVPKKGMLRGLIGGKRSLPSVCLRCGSGIKGKNKSIYDFLCKTCLKIIERRRYALGGKKGRLSRSQMIEWLEDYWEGKI